MSLLRLDEARALLLADVKPVEAEIVPLAECGGRVLAEDIIAHRDQPPDPVSAMDGYAVRSADANVGARLTMIGEAPAGSPFRGIVAPGTAVRIATGGVVPEGADRIAIQEIAEQDGDSVRLVEQPGHQTYVRAAGCDFREGQVLAQTGEVMTAARLGLAAAANRDRLEVRRRPRVAILASGDELREPGAALTRGTIVNSAAYALAELVTSWGGVPIRHAILPDEYELCASALRAADLDVEMIVPLGGASVGERDVLRPLFRALGAQAIFERIAVQPGKPCWHARFADGRLVLGLPGNPASAFVCAQLLLRPLLFALTARPDSGRSLPAMLTRDLPATADREIYLRARLNADEQGRLRVTPDERQDSSLQVPLAAANALVRRLPNAPAAQEGEMAETLLIGELADFCE